MINPSSIYLAVMLELERRRLALGLPMEKFSEWAGIPERYYPKALHCYEPSGRQAQWPTVDRMVNALFPHGYDVIIKPRPGAVIRPNDLKAKLLGLRANTNPISQRELMAELGRKGGNWRAKPENAKRASYQSKNAAKSRWKKQKSLERSIKKRGQEIAAILPPSQVPSA